MILACAGLAWLSQAQPVRSDGRYEGTWTAGTTTMDVAVESWGDDCGPRPVGVRSQGGGSVAVTQDANELTIHARGRQVQTGACWSQNPAMRRTSSSYANGVWTTQCRTPADDPREEIGTYTLNAETPERLRYRDVSRYNWKLKSSICAATITTTQTLHRVAAPPATSSTTATEAREPPPDPPLEPWPDEQAESDTSCAPGAPARVSVRPSKADVELGRRVCFRARVVDARGCPVPRAQVDWSLAHSPAVRASIEGNCFVAGSNAAEAEGEFRVVASHRGLRGRAEVRVRAADLSALLAKRLEAGAITGFDQPGAAGSAGLDAGATAELHTPPARVGARTTGQAPQAAGRSLLLLATLALGMLALGVLLWARRRRRDPVAQHVEAAAPVPGEARENAPGEPGATSPGAEAMATAQAWICPTCRQGFADEGRCPADGAALIPYATFLQQHREREGAPHKRCPQCGKRYPSSSVFCGQDGSPLESVV